MKSRQVTNSGLRAVESFHPFWRRQAVSRRCLHETSVRCATPLPSTAAGPPPSVPLPGASQHLERMARRHERAKTLREINAAGTTPPAARRRFWKNVSIKEAPDGYQILLDHRPVRTPAKSILVVPKNKPQLATAIALEWDLLTTAQQALKQHFIPLTSLVARAESLSDSDKAGDQRPRNEIVDMMLRYLDTDTTLCWAPESDGHDKSAKEGSTERGTGLRELQIDSAGRLMAFLTTRVWPGIEIRHVSDTYSFVPASQPPMTRDVIRGWITGLKPYDLAGLERAAIAGKSLLTAARLVVEWSPEFRQVRDRALDGRRARFGAEDAAEAVSLEVRWQTGMWGEVEDTHDVEREDLLRQFGSVVVLVSGD